MCVTRLQPLTATRITWLSLRHKVIYHTRNCDHKKRPMTEYICVTFMRGIGIVVAEVWSFRLSLSDGVSLVQGPWTWHCRGFAR